MYNMEGKQDCPSKDNESLSHAGDGDKTTATTGMRIKDYIDSVLESEVIREKLKIPTFANNQAPSEKDNDCNGYSKMRSGKDLYGGSSQARKEHPSISTPVKVQTLIDRVVDMTPSLGSEAKICEKDELYKYSESTYGLSTSTVASMSPLKSLTLRLKAQKGDMPSTRNTNTSYGFLTETKPRSQPAGILNVSAELQQQDLAPAVTHSALNTVYSRPTVHTRPTNLKSKSATLQFRFKTAHQHCYGEPGFRVSSVQHGRVQRWHNCPQVVAPVPGVFQKYEDTKKEIPIRMQNDPPIVRLMSLNEMTKIHGGFPSANIHYLPQEMDRGHEEPLNLKKEVPLDLSLKKKDDNVVVMEDGVLDLSKKSPKLNPHEEHNRLSKAIPQPDARSYRLPACSPINRFVSTITYNARPYCTNTAQQNMLNPLLTNAVVRPVAHQQAPPPQPYHIVRDRQSTTSLIGHLNPSDILYLHCNHCQSFYGSVYSFKKHFWNIHGSRPTPADVRIQTIAETKNHFGINDNEDGTGNLRPLSARCVARTTPPYALDNSRSNNRDEPGQVDMSPAVVYQCRYCGKQFPLSEQVEFTDHVAGHESKRTKEWVCFSCKTSCKTQMLLADHMLEHQDLLQHYCVRCCLAFRANSVLKTHQCLCKNGGANKTPIVSNVLDENKEYNTSNRSENKSPGTQYGDHVTDQCSNDKGIHPAQNSSRIELATSFHAKLCASIEFEFHNEVSKVAKDGKIEYSKTKENEVTSKTDSATVGSVTEAESKQLSSKSLATDRNRANISPEQVVPLSVPSETVLGDAYDESPKPGVANSDPGYSLCRLPRETEGILANQISKSKIEDKPKEIISTRSSSTYDTSMDIHIDCETTSLLENRDAGNLKESTNALPAYIHRIGACPPTTDNEKLESKPCFLEKWRLSETHNNSDQDIDNYMERDQNDRVRQSRSNDEDYDISQEERGNRDYGEFKSCIQSNQSETEIVKPNAELQDSACESYSRSDQEHILSGLTTSALASWDDNQSVTSISGGRVEDELGASTQQTTSPKNEKERCTKEKLNSKLLKRNKSEDNSSLPEKKMRPCRVELEKLTDY